MIMIHKNRVLLAFAFLFLATVLADGVSGCKPEKQLVLKPLPKPADSKGPDLSQEEIAHLAVELEQSMKDQDWSGARDLFANLKVAEPGRPGLDAIAKRIDEAIAEKIRIETVAKGIQAAGSIKPGSTSCDDPEAVSSAWKDLRQVLKRDPEYKQARRLASKLELCRRRMERRALDQDRAAVVSKRISFAKQVEFDELRSDFSFRRVSLSGKDKENITIQWDVLDLIQRVPADCLEGNGMYSHGSTAYGFKKLTLVGLNRSCTITLNYRAEAGEALRYLSTFGLTNKMEL